MKADLDIQAVSRNGISHLGRCYFSPPFKVMNITEDKTQAQLHLMLMSSSPGILDGDEYNLKISVEENASLQLFTQSYQRLFNMKQGAIQKTDIHLADNAAFCFLPHPAVPQKQSNFTSINKIYLSNNNSLIFGEILTCGRKLNGEIFRFSKYHSLTEIYLNNKLVVKENLLIEPSTININAIGQLEGHTHQGSLIVINNDLDLNAMNDFITHHLSQQKDIEFGVSALSIKGLIVRIMGQKAEQLHDCLKYIASYISSYKILANAI
ncbi:urease accessory protein UreD [Ferruginibacter sp. SUN002]|uniref:urease accessory protein UreD n=1 Tax=Ferruginibacter sp. SUN002 TaxID=2937789 RepID=UPI003D35AA1C